MPLPPPDAIKAGQVPGMPPPGGGPPSGGGTGPAAAPGPLQGSAVQGMTSLKLGLEALQKALPQLQMGSEVHSSVLKAISDIGKHFAGGGAEQGDQSAGIQQLVEMMRNAKQQPNMAAMMPPGGGGGGGPPGGAPPMGGPPPDAGGAGAMMGA
jgi:hypothetical protein